MLGVVVVRCLSFVGLVVAGCCVFVVLVVVFCWWVFGAVYYCVVGVVLSVVLAHC